jgi:hypothetical protein
MCYNFISNSISLPIFFAVSVFQREMEIPAIPLESLVELFTNGKYCACCVKSGKMQNPEKNACHLRDSACHTKRIKDIIQKLLDHRGFLPNDSGMLMRYDSNCIPYITAFGDDNDRCDLSSHATLARTRTFSCMRCRSYSSSSKINASRSSNGAPAGGDNNNNEPGSTMYSDAASGGNTNIKSDASQEACRLFSSMCFQHYQKQFCDCAMISEGELFHAMENFCGMTTKFAQFFGDMPFFGQHRTLLQNLDVHPIPGCFYDLSRKQVFEQGQPIIKTRCVSTLELLFFYSAAH